MKKEMLLAVSGRSEFACMSLLDAARDQILAGEEEGEGSASHGCFRFSTLSVPDSVEVIGVSVVVASSLVPDAWRCWFWVCISESAPFSWGDNNRTLVTADRFLTHLELAVPDLDEVGVSPEAWSAFRATLQMLGDTYIDLEN